MMIVILVGFFSIFGICGFLAYRKIKATDPNNTDKSTSNIVNNCQDFLPFENIKDGLIDLGNYQYRAIIECSSINYSLKTDREKEIIDLSFQRFLNSLSHPIDIIVQTKTMDNTELLKSLKEDLKDSVTAFPQLENYGQAYYNSIKDLYKLVGNDKEKVKYIVVPYTVTLNRSNAKEKFEYAKREMQNRCTALTDSLQSLGINCTILGTKEVIDILYSVYHKGNVSHADNIVSRDYTSIIVDGDSNFVNVSLKDKLEVILYGTQLKMSADMVDDKKIPKDISEKAQKIINEIDELRDDVSSHPDLQKKFDITKLQHYRKEKEDLNNI